MQNKTFDISDGNICIKISENGELCSLKRDGAIDFIQTNRLGTSVSKTANVRKLKSIRQKNLI
jgi:hypothetical protein